MHKLMRLPGYDYSKPGFYFITLCASYKKNLFGTIKKNKVKFKLPGEIFEKEWFETAKIRKNVVLDEFIVMPNHIHFVLIIVDAGKATPDSVVIDCNQLQNLAITPEECFQILQKDKPIHKFGPQHNNLFTIVSGIKAAVTTELSKQTKKRWAGKLWQPKFYDRIIRTEKELFNVRHYIMNNLEKWCADIKNKRYFINPTEEEIKDYLDQKLIKVS